MHKSIISPRQLQFFPLFFVLYEMASYLSNDAYLPAMPDIQESLQTSGDLVRASLTSWFLGGCFIQLLIGPISDYFGRRKVMLWGGVVFVISTFGCALAPTINWLIWLRFIEGTTIATMAVTGYATIHDMYDTKKSIQTIAFMNSISVLAPAFGPLLGAIVLLGLPWQSIFYLLALWAVIPIILLYWDMPETAPIGQHDLNLKAILKSYKNIILNLRFMIYMLSSRSIFCAMIAWLSAGPFLLDDVYHLDMLHFGIAQVFIFGAYILGTKINKALLDKFRLHTILWQGWLSSFIGCTCSILYALFFSNSFYPILPGLMLITFGAGISLPIYSRLAIEQSNEPMGPKVSMVTFSMTLFGAISTLIVNVFFFKSLLSLTLILGGCIGFGLILFSIGWFMGWIQERT